MCQEGANSSTVAGQVRQKYSGIGIGMKSHARKQIRCCKSNILKKIRCCKSNILKKNQVLQRGKFCLLNVGQCLDLLERRHRLENYILAESYM